MLQLHEEKKNSYKNRQTFRKKINKYSNQCKQKSYSQSNKTNVEFDKCPQKWSHKWNVTLIFLFLKFAFDCTWSKQTEYVRRCEDIVSQFGYFFDWFLPLFHFEYVKMINLWHNFKINRSEKTIIIAT